MIEVIGYQDNKPIYKDFGPARQKLSGGATQKDRDRQVIETARLIESLEGMKPAVSYLSKIAGGRS